MSPWTTSSSTYGGAEFANWDRRTEMWDYLDTAIAASVVKIAKGTPSTGEVIVCSLDLCVPELRKILPLCDFQPAESTASRLPPKRSLCRLFLKLPVGDGALENPDMSVLRLCRHL